MYKQFLLKGLSTKKTSLRSASNLIFNSFTARIIILIQEIINSIYLNNLEFISSEIGEKIISDWNEFESEKNYLGGDKKLCKIYLFVIKYFNNENNIKLRPEQLQLINKLVSLE